MAYDAEVDAQFYEIQKIIDGLRMELVNAKTDLARGRVLVKNEDGGDLSPALKSWAYDENNEEETT